MLAAKKLREGELQRVVDFYAKDRVEVPEFPLFGPTDFFPRELTQKVGTYLRVKCTCSYWMT